MKLGNFVRVTFEIKSAFSIYAANFTSFYVINPKTVLKLLLAQQKFKYNQAILLGWVKQLKSLTILEVNALNFNNEQYWSKFLFNTTFPFLKFKDYLKLEVFETLQEYENFVKTKRNIIEENSQEFYQLQKFDFRYLKLLQKNPGKNLTHWDADIRFFYKNYLNDRH